MMTPTSRGDGIPSPSASGTGVCQHFLFHISIWNRNPGGRRCSMLSSCRCSTVVSHPCQPCRHTREGVETYSDCCALATAGGALGLTMAGGALLLTMAGGALLLAMAGGALGPVMTGGALGLAMAGGALGLAMQSASDSG